MLDEAAGGYGRYLRLLHESDAGQSFGSFQWYQLLCALREGPFGVRGHRPSRIERTWCSNEKFSGTRTLAVMKGVR